MTGTLSPELLDEVKSNTEAIGILVKKHSSTRTVLPETWDQMHRLSASFGQEVEAAGNWGHGILWGLSPRGASIDVGPVIVNFDLIDVRQLR